MKKLILPGVILIVCAAVLGFVFLKQPPKQAATESQAAAKLVFPQTPEDYAISTAVSIISYQNTQYGFELALPDTWKNYKIVTDKWEGTDSNNKVVQSGPILLIRHPQWTEKNPRQDIPIMIFTQAQWNLLKADKFHIGAAPIGPSELGHNSKYVFALPARYNYAFPTGYEEVEQILKNKPLHATENFGK